MRKNISRAFFLLAVLLCGLSNIGFGQSVNLGDPPVVNFTKKIYKAGTQVWDVAQDDRGVMWFGNNDGLLEHDGNHWRLHRIANRTIVRSIGIGENGLIYAGGQGEFGYFMPDAKGILQYHSLSPLAPETERHFGDVWNIAVRPEGVFFRTDHQLFRYSQGKVQALFPGGSDLRFMGEWAGKLIIQDGSTRIFVFENDQFKPLQSPANFGFGTISAILPYAQDTTLVTTIKNGIYFFDGVSFQPWRTQNDDFLKSNIIFCADMLSDGTIALGTSLNGFITIDRQRRIYHHLNRKSGLQNNTILSLMATDQGGVWLGLDNGISYIDVLSPLTAIFPDGELQGTGYTAQVFNDKIYFGTNTGLYATNWMNYYPPDQRYNFTKIRQTEGQVWSLNVLDNSLLVGHHEGAFEINGLNARQLTHINGIWKFIKIAPDKAIAGYYNGLLLFNKTASGWAFESTISGFNESSRLLATDDQSNLWMGHPYRGIYKIKVQPENSTAQYSFYDTAKGLPSTLDNHLFQMGSGIVVTGEKGIFNYAADQDKFVPDNQFEQYFDANTQIKYLNQDKFGHIWYSTLSEVGLLSIQENTLGKKVIRQPIPELTDKLTGGFPFVLPIDDRNVFIATHQGFLHFNPSSYFSRSKQPLRLVVHEIRLNNNKDSLLYGGNLTPGEITLNADQNSVYCSFSAPDYPGNEFIAYSYMLEGADKKWSDWNTRPDLTFSHLNPGNYTLHLKAKNQHGVESSTVSIPLTILPPWYASSLAYAIYITLFAALMLGLLYRQQRQFKEEKQGLVQLHQQQAQYSQEEINRLENEKLEAEVRHKNEDLASATMHIVQKNEILNSIRDELKKLKHYTAPDSKFNKDISHIIKLIDQDARTDADWEQFSGHFDQVHSDFLKRIGDQYGHLSQNDYKLCAYLRLNLTSKEISTLMGISLRGVESGRYRLRKRLGLDQDVNLTEFLMRF